MLNFKNIKTAALFLSALGFCINLQARENIGKGSFTGKSASENPSFKSSNPLAKMGAMLEPLF
jgi:hypothetical protein